MTVQLNQSVLNDETGLLEKFRALSVRYAEIGAREGIRITPFQSAELPLFHALSDEGKAQSTEFLQTIVSIHEETLAAGDSTKNSGKLLWRALQRFSLVPHPEFFSRLQDDDVVLIYNDQQSVMFWSLQFFKHASFTVEQIFCGKWWEYTRRDEAVMKKVHQFITRVANGELSGIFTTGVPAHLVEEMHTPEELKVWTEVPWGSVLTKNGTYAGFLLTHKLKNI